MAVVIEAIYEGQLTCRATHHPSGQELSTTAPLDNGGRGTTFSPTDLVATALGTCVMTIMAQVAERHQIRLEGTSIRVEKEMITQPVRRIGALRTQVTIPSGACEDPKMRQRIEAAAGHCPVHQSLHPDVAIPMEFRWL